MILAAASLGLVAPIARHYEYDDEPEPEDKPNPRSKPPRGGDMPYRPRSDLEYFDSGKPMSKRRKRRLRGKVKSMATRPIGTQEGEQCNRIYDVDQCFETIELMPDDAMGCCICHISPPCSYCTSAMPECPGCGWREEI